MDMKDELNSLLSDKIDLSHATVSSHNDVSKLRELLRQESRCHQETGNCYETLQKEYDVLLCKYAEAENTIDKLRIGAKVDLYSDGPKVNLAIPGVYHERSKSVQQIPLPQAQRSYMSRTRSLPARNLDTNHHSLIPEETIEASRLNLYLRMRDLQDDVVAFHGSLYDNEYSEEEKLQLYQVMRNEYEVIKAELENVNQLENQEGKRTLQEHDPDNLEDEVHELGLRLDEIEDEIGEQIRSKQRQQNKIIRTDDNRNDDKIDTNGVDVDRSDNDVFLNDTISQSRKPDIKLHTWTAGVEDVTSNQSNSSQLDAFDAKYLSRSLGAPADKNTSFSGQTGTENPVASWLRNDKTSVKSGHTSHKENSTKDRNSFPRDQKTADKTLNVQHRPNTMNSTEDSGFVESRRRLTPKKVIPINRAGELSHCSEPRDVDDVVSNTSTGEVYRQRLDSLRDFIRSKRKNEESRLRKDTPRSWVRGIPMKEISPPLLTSEEQKAGNRHQQSSNRYSPEMFHHREPINGSYISSPLHHRQRSPPINDRQFSPSLDTRKYSSSRHKKPHSYTHHNYTSEKHSPRHKSFDEDEQYPERNVTDALYEEMQQIRDLVFDVRHALPVESHSKSPTRNPNIHYVNDKSPKNKSHNKNLKNTSTDNEIDGKQNNSLNKQLQTLNEKLDHLSSKLDSRNNSRASSTSSLISPTTRCSERSGSISSTNSNNDKQIQQLEKLHSKIDDLSTTLTKSTPVVTLKTSTSKPRQEELLEKLETKLNAVEKQINKPYSSTKQTSFLSEPCVMCGGTYIHANEHCELNTSKHYTTEEQKESIKQPKQWYSSTPLHPSTSVRFSTPLHQSSNHSINHNKQPVANNNIFHHYHTFHHSPSTKDTPSYSQRSDKGVKKKSTGTYLLPLDYDSQLHTSLMDASTAAQNMENISRKMLRNIATDLFHSGPSEI